jgi:hypothetical protein
VNEIPTISLADIQIRLQVNRSTAWRLVRKAGVIPVEGSHGRELRIAVSDLPKVKAAKPQRRKIER